MGVPGRPPRADGTAATPVQAPANRRRAAHLAFGAAGLAGLLLLAATAELGGRLVYQYGVGVSAPLAD